MPELDHYRAAKAWGINPDQWEKLTEAGRGVALEVFRTDRLTDAWATHVANKERARAT